MREEQIVPGKGGEIDQRDVFLRHTDSTQLIDVRLPDIEEIFAIFARHEQALLLHSLWTDSVNNLLTDLEMLRIDRRANGHEEILWIGAKIFLHGTHLARVDRVNQISRQLAEGSLAPEAVMDALREAACLGENMAVWYAPAVAFLTAAGFAVMFAGGWVDMIVGGICAALTMLVPRLLGRRDSGGMSSVLLGGILCALIPLVFHGLTGRGVVEAMIASAIMPLLPGLSMTNAVQDLLRGDMVSGVTHAARAVMIAAMLAGGALIGTHMSSWMGLADSPLTSPATLPFDLRTANVLLASSLLAGGGFGALLYAPRKAIIWGGLLGSAGYLSYWAAMECGAAETAAMFIGALVAALGAQIAARRLKMIATVFVTIAILPLVPGVGLYRAMSALATGDMMAGASIAAHTMALILMIALGIGLGTALVGADRGAKH